MCGFALLRRIRRLRRLCTRDAGRAPERDRGRPLPIRLLDEPAVSSALLLSALGFVFSPATVLCVLCLGAAASVVPITGGGAVASLGATAGILFALGVAKNIAINFSLAPSLLLITSASAAALAGLALSVATRAVARRGSGLPA